MSILRASITVTLACLVWVSVQHAAHAQTNADIEPFFRSVDLPIAVAVVHRASSEIGDDFFEALVEADAGGLLRHEQRARSFSDANVVVFIIDDWAEVATLPFQDQLSYLYEPVSALPETVAGFGTRLIGTDDTQIGVVFVAERYLPEDALDCGVLIFFRLLLFGFDEGELSFNDDTPNCRG